MPQGVGNAVDLHSVRRDDQKTPPTVEHSLCDRRKHLFYWVAGELVKIDLHVLNPAYRRHLECRDTAIWNAKSFLQPAGYELVQQTDAKASCPLVPAGADATAAALRLVSHKPA